MKSMGERQMLEQIKRKFHEYMYNRLSSSIDDTGTVQLDHDSNCIVVTQLHKKALYMGIVALKTFFRHTGLRCLHVINDGSLNANDLELLKKHFSTFTLTSNAEIDVGVCPKGGCWERLIYVAKLSKSRYVIQLDSDTLTMMTPFEVLESVKSNSGFLVGNGPSWNYRISLDLMKYIASTWNSSHVQALSEQLIGEISSLKINTYIRGCAGFTGFPQRPDALERLVNISTSLEGFLGKDKWQQWGSEQVTSNIILSSYEDTKILSWPIYQNFGFPDFNDDFKKIKDKVTFIHFIGSNRFKDNTYAKLTKKALEIL